MLPPGARRHGGIAAGLADSKVGARKDWLWALPPGKSCLALEFLALEIGISGPAIRIGILWGGWGLVRTREKRK